MTTSCLRCQWLFTRDTGYSNYTVEDTEMHCVMRRNPKLPTEIPDEVRKYTRKGYAWMQPENDKWHATKDGRCELYQRDAVDDYCHIDCDGDDIEDIETGRRMLTEEADPMPLLIAQYFNKE